MSYSDFTLARVAEQFELSVDEQDLFGTTPGIAVDPTLTYILGRYRSLARGVASEKARSEFLIAPVLAEVRFHWAEQISLFSGIDLPAAPELGLSGICDFVFSRSPQQLFLTRPIVAVVEAKNENLTSGFGQCIAEMVGAKIFNEKKQHLEATIFGVVTTGTLWRFLRLQDNQVVMDATDFEFKQIDQILGILTSIIRPIPESGKAGMMTSSDLPAGSR